MALTFPLTRAAFMDLLPAQDVALSCRAQHQMTGLAGGEVLRAEVAPAMWDGRIQLAPMKARDAARIEALLAALEGPGRTFKAYKRNQIGPASDPLGHGVDGLSPTLAAVDEAASQLQIAGLRPGYRLRAGDFLSFAYGANPTRQAFHRLLEDVVADQSGTTPLAQVDPHIRAGASVGAAVDLVRPWFKALLVPGSVDYGTTRQAITTGLAFSFRQTLR